MTIMKCMFVRNVLFRIFVSSHDSLLCVSEVVKTRN